MWEDAVHVWYIVEEYFRLHPELKTDILSKVNLFETYLLQRHPKLTKQDLNYLNKAIAGMMNESKQSTVTLPNVSVTDN